MTRSGARLSTAMMALLALAGCATGPMSPTAAPAPPAVAAAPVGLDQDFLNRAATGTNGQVQLGRLAQQRGFAPAVRSFGAHIATEHARANARLMELAQRLGMMANPGMPNLSDLAVLGGPDFDRQFIADQMTNQREALALFQGEAQLGQEPRLRRFARDWVPILQRDLQRTQAIASRTGS